MQLKDCVCVHWTICVYVCGCRRLERVKAAKRPEYVMLYDRMKEKMEESERLKPSFLNVAEQLW